MYGITRRLQPLHTFCRAHLFASPAESHMVSRGLGATRKSWLSSLDDTEFAYVGGSALALLVVLVAGCVLLIRRLSASRRRQDIEPAFAEEYDVLQVIVHAHDQEAELEVQTDAWSSYEEVRPIATLDACPRLVFFSRYLTILCATPLCADAAARARGGCSAHDVPRHRRADTGVSGCARPMEPRQDEDARGHCEGGTQRPHHRADQARRPEVRDDAIACGQATALPAPRISRPRHAHRRGRGCTVLLCRAR